MTSDPELPSSTKDQQRATEALGLKGQRVLLDYDERQVNKNGRTYTNRYFNGAKPLQPAPTQTFDQTPRQTRAPLPPEERWSIVLQVGAKLAVDTLPLMPDEQRSFEVQKQIAIGWAKFLFYTPLPAEESVPAFAGGAAAPGAYTDPGSETPPPSDDDIPY